VKTRSPFDLLPGLRKSLYFPLKAALEIVEQRFATLDAEFGLTVREVLIAIAANERQISQGALAECLGLNTNVMVKLIDSAEAKGIVQRVQNPQNRREKLIAITPKGKRIVRHFHANHRERTVKDVFLPLTPQNAEQVLGWACDIIDTHYNAPWTHNGCRISAKICG
jgi:DNA-binding MarR family transcriptional regulator